MAVFSNWQRSWTHCTTLPWFADCWLLLSLHLQSLSVRLSVVVSLVYLCGSEAVVISCCVTNYQELYHSHPLKCVSFWCKGGKNWEDQSTERPVVERPGECHAAGRWQTQVSNQVCLIWVQGLSVRIPASICGLSGLLVLVITPSRLFLTPSLEIFSKLVYLVSDFFKDSLLSEGCMLNRESPQEVNENLWERLLGLSVQGTPGS